MEDLEKWVIEAVRDVQVVDVHTHLFPPSHGQLMLWGVDSLLTYHYLVAELFTVVSPKVTTPSQFFELSKRDQATLVWEHLFIKRSPLSEAARGVLTTLKLLGLHEQVQARDLESIRAFFSSSNPAAHVEQVFQTARVKYCVMTNIPFEPIEVSQWNNPDAKAYSNRFKAAVRIDPVLKGDWPAFEKALKEQGFPCNVKGAQDFLLSWANRTDALYFMASTPSGFHYLPELFKTYKSMDELEYNLSGSKEEKSTELIDKIMIPSAREKGLPLALKLGAVRGVNPQLDPCGGGDAVETSDLAFVANLARRFPDLKILLTVLSRVNQHELCVLANKFGNLHVYGCWWYCNVPSIIDETTRLRLEILGTGFTAQHSDARVLEQLLYKWEHSRQVIGRVLVEKYRDLFLTGWQVTKEEIHRDVARLFGDSYLEFMDK